MSKPSTRRGIGPFGATKPGGVKMNHKGLRSVREVTLDHFDAEYLYLRENELVSFDSQVRMDYLRVLDLSINEIGGAVDILKYTPHLHHLYMTGNKIDTLVGLSNFSTIETLCLSDNSITSFSGLENLPNLRVLSLNFNNITSFESYPALPSLHTLNLVGNPITDAPSYRPMAIAVNGESLVSVDGNPVMDEERAEAEKYKGKIAYCVREGFTVEGDHPEVAADAFMVKMQRARQESKCLQLCSIQLTTETEDGEMMEGVPITLSICTQDARPYAQRTTEVFQSSYLYPVIFKVSGEASEVFVVGSMNNWTEPISLERCVEGDEVYFHTTLYLPAGDYEYRYIVDGVEKVSEANSMPSKFKQGFCNIYKVAELEPQEEEQDTILHIRWLRTAPNGSYDVIEEENTLSYVPVTRDIDGCVRAEVLAYVDGTFSFLYFDISTPIRPAPPQCPRLEVTGEAAEGGLLTAEADYLGGTEGISVLKWYRVLPDGMEEEMDVVDPWAGYETTADDIGCRIRAEFTPVRNDWVAGESKSVTTDEVTAGAPECHAIKIIGNLIEGSELEVDVDYHGGKEGKSFYQWLRRADTKDKYIPIPGANGTTYVVTQEDVGECLAVEYTAVNIFGFAGETCRCVLDNPIEAAAPRIENLAIVGELMEGYLLAVEYDYYGGQSRAPQIQWQRRDQKHHIITKIGEPNTPSIRLTTKEVGFSIEVSVTPARWDGVTGKVVVARRDGPVQAVEPSLTSLNFVGEAKAGSELRLQVDYRGGVEGKSTALWEVQDPETGVYSVVARNAKKYAVQKSDAGKTLRVSYTPVRADGAVGEPMTRTVQVDKTVGYVDPARSPSTTPPPSVAPERALSPVADMAASTRSSKKPSAKASPQSRTPHSATPQLTPQEAEAQVQAPPPPEGHIHIVAKTHDSDEDSEK